jgi:transcriptional regulator with XRE-family HTH domain
MTSNPVDIERIRAVLRKAIRPAGTWSGRGLAREAGLNRDAVYDIVNGRNENPSVMALAAIAQALGRDLSVFGLQVRSRPPSATELEAAILESLPAMPRRGSWERKASFLAEAVAASLRLPPARPARRRAADRPRRRGRGAAGAPRAPTS